MAAVVVLGSVNMDLVVRVPSLPRPGETALGDRLLRVHGGKGANQAAAAARLGAHVKMIGRVGRDDFGRELVAGLEADDVDVAGLTADRDLPSGVALIVVDRDGEDLITVAPGANGAVGDEEVAVLRRALRPGDVVVAQLEIPLAAVAAAVAAAHEAGARFVLNAAPSEALAGKPVPAVDLLIVNRAEAEALGGPAALRASVGALAVTAGPAGATLHERSQQTAIEPRKVDAVDGTAAGDAFVGATAFAMSRGWSLADAAALGAAAGAAAATKFGARPSLPTPDELKRLFGVEIGEHAMRLSR